MATSTTEGSAPSAARVEPQEPDSEPSLGPGSDPQPEPSITHSPDKNQDQVQEQNQDLEQDQDQDQDQDRKQDQVQENQEEDQRQNQDQKMDQEKNQTHYQNHDRDKDLEQDQDQVQNKDQDQDQDQDQNQDQNHNNNQDQVKDQDQDQDQDQNQDQNHNHNHNQDQVKDQDQDQYQDQNQDQNQNHNHNQDQVKDKDQDQDRKLDQEPDQKQDQKKNQTHNKKQDQDQVRNQDRDQDQDQNQDQNHNHNHNQDQVKDQDQDQERKQDQEQDQKQDQNHNQTSTLPEREDEEDEEEEEEDGRRKATGPTPEDQGLQGRGSDPDQTEERFRIDRKKLECMLYGPRRGDGLSGEEFFERVMRETDTQVKWPSKLKIGAKSKKDPHVKVEGKRANVLEAKRKILEVLETKVNKVTLKMDVAHTEHSHVIGKGGGNIKNVMGVTSCHIHFPDSNRHNATGEKSNQVSIAGPVEGVEAARRSIRDLQPLALTFDLPASPVPQPQLDAGSPVIQQVSQALGVGVSFRAIPPQPPPAHQSPPAQPLYASRCCVRGLQGNAADVQKAVCVLMELLLGPEVGGQGAGLIVSSQLDVTSQQHLFMLGQNGAHFLAVMHQTQTQIILPDPSAPQSPPSLLVQGSPEGVCLARQQLMDCLPVCLMFDMREEGETDPRRLNQMMQDLEVFISIKPKVKQTSKSVVVKGLERNMSSLYEARRLLLGLDSCEIAKVTQPTPDPTNGLTHYWLSMLLQQLRLAEQGPLFSQVAMGSQCHNNKPRPSMPPGLTTPTEEGRSGLSWTGSDCRPLEKILENEDHSGQSEKERGGPLLMTSAEAGEAVTNGGHAPRMLSGRRGSLQGPEHCRVLSLGRRHSTGQAFTHRLLSGELEGGARRDRRNSLRREVILVHDVLDESSLRDDESSLGDEDYDYEQKKLLASRAMQRKPMVTEVQTPTDHWSGLGFSKSMPAEAVKELRNVSRRSYKPYLSDGSASQQLAWAHQALRDRACNGSNSDNWRDRRGSASSVSSVPTSSSSSSSPSSPPAQFSSFFSSSASSGNPLPPFVSSSCNRGRGNDKVADSFMCSSGSYFEGGTSCSRRASTCSQRSPSPLEDDLPEVLCQLGLGKYVDVLHQQEIDYQTFLTLSDEDLKEVGVSTFGARRKMLLAICELTRSKRRLSDTSSVKSVYLEGGASGRLPPIVDLEVAGQSKHW
ncbi:bicaudal C homolog 2 [Gadus macrocephalus]|uniref:bicaudal C homolog 2 n=1 Tax=Gadus macrocephalus TaxID=80720 RepID=UPI0028CB41AA|nr:bicaudal C homolog 2 [Gadus macrocephalus]